MKNKTKILLLLVSVLVLLGAVLAILTFNSQKTQDPNSGDFNFTVAPVRVHEYDEADIPKEKEEEDNHIIKAAVVGVWARALEKDTQVGLRCAYDMKNGTRWNPQANSKYAGDPGVVFLLDGYYDLESWSVQLDKRAYFFDLYVSEDGVDFTLLHQITKDNAAEYYNEKFLCTISGLNAKRVAFVKLVFTGAAENTTYVNLHEVSFTGTFLEVGPYEIPISQSANVTPKTLVASHKIIGSWKKDLAEDNAYGPKMAYDENIYTRWNPEAKTGFKGDPGIVFTLKQATDIRKIQVMLSAAHHYFNVYVSADGATYTKIANIHSRNADRAYQAGENETLLCTLDGLKCDGIRYVKIIFTGRPNGNTFVNFMELIISEEGTEGLDTSWMLMAEKSSTEIQIQSYQIIGNWKDDGTKKSSSPDKSYDGDLKTKWNPIAGDEEFTGEPGIIYTLKKVTDLKKMVFTLGTEMHWFDVYVSTDGTEYTKIASICKQNADQAYTDGNGGKVCTLDGLSLEGVKYVKVIYTGRLTPKNAYVNAVEFAVSAKGSENLDISWMMPESTDEEDDNTVSIVAHQTIGNWKDDGSDKSSSADKSYDGDYNTKWNPVAGTEEFTGEPGVIYTLNRNVTLRKLIFTFGTEMHWFDVYVSADGADFSKIAEISPANAELGYTDGNGGKICTLDGLLLENVQYIKVVYTGRLTPQNAYVNAVEVEISESGSENLDISWMLPAEPEEPNVTEPTEPTIPEESVKATITSATVGGNWKDDASGKSSNADKTFDGDVGTKWNPTATDFASDEHIVFTLDKAYDLSKIVITVGSRYHFFTVSGSTDGVNYMPLAKIGADNYAEYYLSDYVCTVDGLQMESMKYLKVHCDGTPLGISNLFVNFFEIELFGTVSDEQPEVTEPEVTEPEVTESETTEPEVPNEETEKATITSALAGGTWGNTDTGKLHMAYDGNTGTKWNPTAKDFASDEHVVFTLTQPYDLSRIVITAGSRYHFFTISGSADGVTYAPIAQVNANNYTEFYQSAFTCTVSGLCMDNIQYIKVHIDGTPLGISNLFVNFHEIEVYGTATEVESEEPVEPEMPNEETGKATVTAGVVGGKWKDDASGKSANADKAWDGDFNTKWNPTATDFASDEHIVFALEKAYDLSRIVLTVGSRYHFFTIYGSTDGENYAPIAHINAANYTTYYLSGYTCTVSGLSMDDVRYIKVRIDGTPLGISNLFVNFQEIEIYGKPSEQK